MCGRYPLLRTTDNDPDLPKPQRRGGLHIRKSSGDLGKPERSIGCYPEVAFQLLGYQEKLLPSFLLHLGRRTSISLGVQRPDVHSGLQAGRAMTDHGGQTVCLWV